VKNTNNNSALTEQLSKLFPYGTHKILAIDLGIKDSDLSTMIKVLPELLKKLKLTVTTEEEIKDKDEMIRLLRKYV